MPKSCLGDSLRKAQTVLVRYSTKGCAGSSRCRAWLFSEAPARSTNLPGFAKAPARCRCTIRRPLSQEGEKADDENGGALACSIGGQRPLALATCLLPAAASLSQPCPTCSPLATCNLQPQPFSGAPSSINAACLADFYSSRQRQEGMASLKCCGRAARTPALIVQGILSTTGGCSGLSPRVCPGEQHSRGSQCAVSPHLSVLPCSSLETNNNG
jgi:hypothetical protein